MGEAVDELDAKIIKELLANARKSFVEIAAECNVSTATIGDRFTELEKAGIITGSTIQVNRRTLGYKAVCNMFVKVDPNEIDQVLSYIKKIPFDIPMLNKDGKSSISLVAGLKDVYEVGKLKEIIRRNQFVRDLKVEIWTGVKNTPENLEIIPLKRYNAGKHTSSPLESHKFDFELDDIDLQMIEKLSQDSMQPFGKLAKEIGTSINTISRKYKKLTENGIIKPTIQLNLPKLGYHAVMIFALTFASQSDTDAVIREVMGIKDNTLIIKTSGEFDLFVFVMLKDISQLLSTQSQIGKISGISRVEMVVLPVLVPWPANREYISTF